MPTPRWSLTLLFALALGVLPLGACRTPPPRSALGATIDPNADFAPRIDSPAVWAALASSPGRERIARSQVVKVIVDLEDANRVYFLQSRRWEIHYYFARRFLDRPGHPVGEHGAFNIQQYRRPDRRFVLATILHQRDQDAWCFELTAGDNLDIPRTVAAFEAVRALVHFRDRLRYHPVPPSHEADLQPFREARVPLITSQELYANLRYQPVIPGVAYGYLRVMRSGFDPARVRRTDILVLPNVPLDIPVCAGIVTAEIQTPLAHVAVLAANRGTPDMALRDAMENPTLRGLDGRLVRFEVGPQEWTMRPASQSDADRAWAAMRPRGITVPPLDPRDPGLPDITTLRMRDVNVAGAKAAQLAELSSLAPLVETPRAFVVPFAAFLRHFDSNGITALRDAVLAETQGRDDPARRAERFAELRARIAGAPIDPSLVSAVRRRIDALFPGTRVRLRSSTNAEDLPGFNGAGLYRSVVIPAGASDAVLADGIRAVWASTWNLTAHEERSFFRIDPTRVAMAILVQESIDDDVVNGVAITANPFNQGRPALFINTQLAGDEGGAVTSARGDEVPEQVLYYAYGAEGEYERLARSSRTRGAPVLNDAELRHLADALRAIHRRFLPDDEDDSRAMDVEFILAGASRRLVVVQARPYPMRYDQGRGWAMPPE